MCIKSKISILLLLCFCEMSAQFPPPAGQEGSTAISADSSVFTGWGETVVVERGFMNMDEPSLGYADYGTDSDALGKADNMVVSLGDGGSAIFSFDPPIINGQGPDFAVFENSLWDDFLELCFVEVSSDGENFVRFPAITNVPNDVQLGGFGTMDASLIHNFGGKYRAMFGTPFDLEELKDEPGLDVNQISHIRLVDVVGSIDPAYASFDSQGNLVNDPWPTPWNSSGFDLDALGIIHQAVGISEFDSSKESIEILFLNDEQKLLIRTRSGGEEVMISVFDLSGRMLQRFNFASIEKEIDLGFLKNGLYVVNVRAGLFSRSEKILLQD
ncbi:MAG: T9SS type A sorting domain-containing protein [Bacteroidales bacterium]|nr:T9SS type A sorting domain-containing protein [Bacteroidales bacterium]MCF8456648.1 T9SS type A sorting domain-containing protein [Bacteroidales bacterium]